MLAFAIVLAVLALAFQYYMVSRGQGGLGHTVKASKVTVEPGEAFEIVTELTNGSRRFLPFVAFEQAIPPELQLLTPGVEVREGGQGVRYMADRTYLMPRQRLTRRVRASLPRRGRYFLRGATLHIGDFLGLSETEQTFMHLGEIVVFPAPAPYAQALETLGGFLGDVSVNRFIFEDPVLTLGFREYTLREPMKQISWSQTARAGRLMVKNFDHTLEPTVTVLLNVEHAGDDGPALMETCFSLARTVCETLEGRGIAYGFVTNASAAGALSLWSAVGEGLGPRHLATILEGLGRATYACTGPLDALLTPLARRAEQGRAFILITPAAPPPTLPALAALRARAGGLVCVISAREVM